MKVNLEASIRQRLLNLSKETSQSFQRVLDRFVLERVLYRLSMSPHRDAFVLKGASLYHLAGGPTPRPTRDLDLMAWGNTSIPALEATFRDICNIPCAEDGLVFDPTSVMGERIREENPYQGVRVMLRGRLGTARASLQVDIGFGDAIIPEVQKTTFPSLLGLPEPNIRAYRWETVIAEKFEAMVSLGMANTRMKDFFDLWHLPLTQALDQNSLRKALRSTFQRRGTKWPTEIPIALTDQFAGDAQKQAQWRAFLRKSQLDSNLPFPEIVEAIRNFLWPMIQA